MMAEGREGIKGRAPTGTKRTLILVSILWCHRAPQQG